MRTATRIEEPPRQPSARKRGSSESSTAFVDSRLRGDHGVLRGFLARSRALLSAAGLALSLLAPDAVAQITMLTGEEAADLRVGRDLAELVAAAANVQLEVVAAPSAPETLERLRTDPSVKLAAAHADVYRAFLARAGDAAPPPRVMLALPDKEIHFVARAEAPFDYLHQIEDARINAGPPQSGTAAATGAIYRLMFGRALDGEQTTFLPHEEALVKLVTDGTIDVVAIAAGQPAALLANVNPEARRYIKLLALDPGHPAAKSAMRAYPAATVRAASYPALLAEDVQTLAVRMYLVTLDYRDHATETRLIRFSRALCQRFPDLRTKGHPKWREAAPRLAPLPAGWKYYPPTRDELRGCRAAAL